MSKQAKSNPFVLLGRLALYHKLSVNAQRRAMTHAGTETGRKAWGRYDHYEEKFSETESALAATIGAKT